MTASLSRNDYERRLRQRNPEFAERQRENCRQWGKLHPERKAQADWANHIWKTYGIRAEQYQKLLEAQGGGCKFCGRTPKKNHLPVDHDHQTGRVRGILCIPCNRALGILERNIEKVVTHLKGEA